MLANGHRRTTEMTAAPPRTIDAIALRVSGPAGGAQRARPLANTSRAWDGTLGPRVHALPLPPTSVRTRFIAPVAQRSSPSSPAMDGAGPRGSRTTQARNGAGQSGGERARS